MSNNKRGEDFLFDWWNELVDPLGGSAAPASLLSTQFIGRIFELQRTVLQHSLGQGSEDGSATEHEREAMKALMQCSLNVMKSTREYRKSVIDAQSAFLDRYADLIDEALRKPSEAKDGSKEEPKSDAP